MRVQNIQNSSRQDMHSKKTEIISSAKAWDDQLLLCDRGSRLFKDLFNLVKMLFVRHSFAPDRSIVRKHPFAGGLHRRNGAFFCARDIHQLLSAGFIFSAQVKMIAHEMKKGVARDKFTRTEQSVTIALRLVLSDELHLGGDISKRALVPFLIQRRNYQPDLIDSGAQDFVKNDLD